MQPMRNPEPVEPVTNLEQMIERLARAGGQGERVAVGDMLGVIGYKSFGPLLLFAGLIAFSPASGIPGVPTFVGLLVLLTAAQVLCGRSYFWLPGWITRRTVPGERYQRILDRIRPGARRLDRVFRPRLTALTQRTGTYVIALVCALIGLAMPPMEVLPFAATTAGAALTAFGLALVVHDGLITLFALLITAGGFTLVVQQSI